MQFWRHIRKSIHELVLPKSNNKRHHMELLNNARFYQRAHFDNRLGHQRRASVQPRWTPARGNIEDRTWAKATG